MIRAPFFRSLVGREDLHLRVFCQASIPGTGLTTTLDGLADWVTVVPFVGLRRERLGWQRLPWRRLLSSFDVLVVLGNPRVVSNVVLACLARLVGKQVVLCGHAHTAGARPLTERLRLWWWRRFDHLLVYTDGDIRRLRARGFRRQHLVGLNNGLDQRRIDEAAAPALRDEGDDRRAGHVVRSAVGELPARQAVVKGKMGRPPDVVDERAQHVAIGGRVDDGEKRVLTPVAVPEGELGVLCFLIVTNDVDRRLVVEPRVSPVEVGEKAREELRVIERRVEDRLERRISGFDPHFRELCLPGRSCRLTHLIEAGMCRFCVKVLQRVFGRDE